MIPEAVCAGSEAQKLYCIRDAQADIATLVAFSAAIPEMLAALEGVIPYMEAAEGKGLLGHEGCHWPVEAVRAAIASAKGEL